MFLDTLIESHDGGWTGLYGSISISVFTLDFEARSQALLCQFTICNCAVSASGKKKKEEEKEEAERA